MVTLTSVVPVSAGGRRRIGFLRLLATSALLALSGAALIFDETVRATEALISALALNIGSRYEVYPWRDQVVLSVGDGHLALRITAECTSLIVLIPLALFIAAIILCTRASPLRSILAFLIAALIVFAANIVRVLVIVVGAYELGRLGYGWTHTVIGTAIIAAATILGGILMLRILKNDAAPAGRRSR